MKISTNIILLIAAALMSSCASTFSPTEASEVTPQILEETSSCQNEFAEFVWTFYVGSDSRYHYFHRDLVLGGSYKVDKTQMRFPDEFPLSRDGKSVLLVGHYDKASGSWIQVAPQSMKITAPNQPPLRMPVSGTPAADAPVAPPPGIAGR